MVMTKQNDLKPLGKWGHKEVEDHILRPLFPPIARRPMISDLGLVTLRYWTKIIPTLFLESFININLLYHDLCNACSLAF